MMMMMLSMFSFDGNWKKLFATLRALHMKQGLFKDLYVSRTKAIRIYILLLHNFSLNDFKFMFLTLKCVFSKTHF